MRTLFRRFFFQPLAPFPAALVSLLGAAAVAPAPVAALAHMVGGVRSGLVVYAIYFAIGAPVLFALLWKGWHRWWQYLAAGLASGAIAGIAFALYALLGNNWPQESAFSTALGLLVLSVTLASIPAVPAALLAWLFLRRASTVLTERLHRTNAA